MSAERPTRSSLGYLRFIPFLFLGVVFVGHGPTAIILSLIVSVALSAGISMPLVRRHSARRGHRSVSFDAMSSGLNGTLSIGNDGIRWIPRASTMPPWFIPWLDIMGTSVTDDDGRAQLSIDLVGGETVVVTVGTDPATLEGALTEVRGVRSS